MTVKELKEVISDLPDSMVVTVLGGTMDIDEGWDIDDYILITKPGHHTGIYLHHQ